MNDFTEILNNLIFEVGIYHNQAIAIMQSFFSDFSDMRELIDMFIEHKDFQAIQRQAHQLRGTTANLRLSHVSAVAALLESAAKECNVVMCEENMKKIVDEINDLKLQMKATIEDYKLKTLIVEDNIASGRVLEQIILNLGHISLGIVASPEKAFLSVKNSPPDVVFMDIDLSAEMDGIHTAELISGYHSIPVVFVSIHADEITLTTAKEYGVGYIVKPYTQQEVEEMIRVVCENMMKKQTKCRTDRTKIKVKNDNRIFFLELNDVILFESRAHTIILHTSEKKYQINSSLKDIKVMDKQNNFIQPHRSFLVNRAYVEELINENYNYHLKVKCISNPIPVSQKSIKKIKSLF